MYFPQGFRDLVDAAQRKGADYAIKASVLERQPFTANYPPIHFYPPLPDPLFGAPVHTHVGIDHRELTDVGRVMRHVQAGSKANFQNPAAGADQQVAPVFGHELPIQTEIAKQRKDGLGIEAHRHFFGAALPR